MRNKIEFYLNGKKMSVGANYAKMMLADYLRYELGLTGTKIVCGEGDCGSCSVLKYFPNNNFGKSYFILINACITTVAQMDGSSLITVEALEEDGELNHIQKTFHQGHGSQCGFCTPGFVMALAGLAEKRKTENALSPLSDQDVKNALTGNLCRCTGYKHIIEAGKNVDLEKVQLLKDRYFSDAQENDLKNIYSTPVTIEGEGFRFYAPKSIDDATRFLADHPDTKIISATTDLGVLHNKRKFKIQNVVSLHLIDELYSITKDQNKVSFGARVTFSALRSFLKTDVPEFSEYIDIFASPPIKNTATLVGNIANGSPIGDSPPVLMALNAVLEIKNNSETKHIPLKEFYLSYKKTKLSPGDIITGVTFDIPSEKQNFFALKNSNRKDMDISSVSMSMLIDWKNKKDLEIENISLACGGIAATVLELKKTQDFLSGKKINTQTIEEALEIFHTEFTPLSDVRSTSSYRHIVLDHYFRRCFSEISKGSN